MNHFLKRAPLTLALLACAPSFAHAQGPLSTGRMASGVQNAAGVYIAPQPVHVVGLDSASGLYCVVGSSPTCGLPGAVGLYGGMTATLISNASAATTGAAVAHVYKDSYFFACAAAAWNGASAQLQYLGPDGATWLNFTGAALTANGVIGVGIGANATIRATLAGAPTTLSCNLT
jgi:hypothetical protein